MQQLEVGSQLPEQGLKPGLAGKAPSPNHETTRDLYDQALSDESPDEDLAGD